MRVLPPYHPIAVFLHIIHGFIAGVFAYYNACVSGLLFAQFLAYQVIESVKTRDYAFFELREWIAGYTVGLLAVYLQAWDSQLHQR